MDVKQIVEITITDMENGEITGHILNNKQFTCNNNNVKQNIKTPNTDKTTNMDLNVRNYKRMTNKVDKWIQQKNITRFCFKDFFKDYPDDYYQRKRIQMYISRMVDDRTLTQVGRDTFVVTKKIR